MVSVDMVVRNYRATGNPDTVWVLLAELPNDEYLSQLAMLTVDRCFEMVAEPGSTVRVTVDRLEDGESSATDPEG